MITGINKLILLLLIAGSFFFTGCKAPVKEGGSSALVQQKADTAESESGQPELQIKTRTVPDPADTEIVQTDKNRVEESKEEQSAAEPPSMEAAAVVTESVNIGLFKNIATLVPSLPEGVSSEPILRSAPIPGKPVIAIYRIREGSPADPETEKENGSAPEEKAEPEIALKPEPVVVNTPEPIVTIDPDPVTTEPEIVTVPKEVEQSEAVKTEKEIPLAQVPEVTEQEPVIEKRTESVVEPTPEAAGGSDSEIRIQTEAEIAQEPAVVPTEADSDIPLIDIITPLTGTFYSKKIQIEGRIANSENDSESVNNIEKVTWEIDGIKDPEELFFGSDGVFFLSFSAAGFSGEIDFIIKAEDRDNKTNTYTIKMFDGNVTPEITLDSPVDGSLYGAAVRISGRVSDPSASSLNLTGPKRLSYSLFSVNSSSTEKQIEGIIPVKPDGSFSADIYTDNISGEQLVTITAEGQNGRIVKRSVTMEEGESDIPGFTVDQENGSVRLNWDPLPGVESYSLFYSEKGSDPLGIDGSRFSNVESPLFIRNFKEGFLYRFQLEAVPVSNNTSGQKNYLSGIKEIIILTGDTLKPVVTPGYQQISLVWLNIPGSEEFDILRDVDSSGNFQVIKHSVFGTSYVDRDVEFGKNYSYKIKPVLPMSTGSYAVSAASLPFPEEKSVVLGRYGSSNLQGITVAGSYIFLADGSGGMRIIDNADTGNPIEVGRFPTEDARDIVIRGERAYVADGYRGIKILDINNPGTPVLLGSRKTTDATKLVLKDNTVFIADGKSGIKIIDITSERRPVRSGFIDTDNARDLVISGSELLIADGPGGFRIAEIEGESALKLVGNISYSNALSVAVKGKTAYIADGEYGVRIVDISQSDNPVEIGSIPVDDITDIVINKNYIFTSSLSMGLNIYEITDPRRPVLFDSVDFTGVSSLTLNNGVVYLADREGYKTVESFTTGRSFVIAEYKTDGKAYNLTYIDHKLYLADHRNGVKIIDVSNPTDSSSFSVTDKLDTSYAESVVGYGSRLLIADGKGGVVLGNITNLDDGTQQIDIEESVDLPGITKSLVVDSGSAYIAAREEGMHILDLESKEVRTVYTGGSVQEIAVDKNYIVIADGSGGIRIYKNKDKAIPELISTVKLPNSVTVALQGPYIVAGGRDGLSVVDISKPSAPEIVSSFSAGWIEDIYLASGYIYAAAGSEGLIILDMKNPEDLVLVSTCKDIYAVGVEVEDDLAFVADVDGFKVVKILIPSWLQ